MRDNKKCLHCNKIFYRPYKCWIKVWDKRKYCSHKCYSEAITDRKLLETTKKKMSKRMLGNKFRNGLPAWSKGLTKKTDKRVASISKKLKEKGICPPLETRFKKGHKINIGRKTSDNIKAKQRLVKLGKKNPMYSRRKPGRSLYSYFHCCLEFKSWRLSVFERDKFVCQMPGCNQLEKYVEAHHIKAFSKIVKEYKLKTIEDALKCKRLLSVSNGITLCRPCHQKTLRKEDEFLDMFNAIISNKKKYAKSISTK